MFARRGRSPAIQQVATETGLTAEHVGDVYHRLLLHGDLLMARRAIRDPSLLRWYYEHGGKDKRLGHGRGGAASYIRERWKVGVTQTNKTLQRIEAMRFSFMSQWLYNIIGLTGDTLPALVAVLSLVVRCMLSHLVSSATPPLWWAVPNVLAGTSMPLAEDLPLLHRAGIRGIVCLLELPHLAEAYSNAGFAVHMLPLSDGSAPTPEQFRTFLQFMEHQRRVDHPVIVHCLAGRGRTGTVVAAYLIAHGHTVDGALAHIRSLQPLAVETPQQLDFLHEVDEKRLCGFFSTALDRPKASEVAADRRV